MGRPPKRKPIQRKKKSDDKETSQRVQEKHIFSMTVLDRNEGDNKITLQTVVEKDTVPSTTLTNDEEGADSKPCEVACPKSDYNITFTRRGEQLIGTIYWKVGKYYDLQPNIRYVCELPRKDAKCCNVWKFCVKKCRIFMLIGLYCHVNDRNVTFSVLLGDKTSPLLTVEATEQMDGIYTGDIRYSTLERYKDELTQKVFTLKCQLTLYVKDMTRSEYPHRMCSCNKLTYTFATVYGNPYSGDVTLKVGVYPFDSHACIIAARCSVLQNYLKKDAAIVPLFDRPVVTFDVFYQLLLFIYTGTTLPLTVDTAICLVYLSTALQLRELRSKCRRFLTMKLSKESFLKIHCLAVVRNSIRLQRATKAFFLQNQDLMESINSEQSDSYHRPLFVTTEQFENIMASLKGLVASAQNLQDPTTHDANEFAEQMAL